MEAFTWTSLPFLRAFTSKALLRPLMSFMYFKSNYWKHCQYWRASGIFSEETDHSLVRVARSSIMKRNVICSTESVTRDHHCSKNDIFLRKDAVMLIANSMHALSFRARVRVNNHYISKATTYMRCSSWEPIALDREKRLNDHGSTWRVDKTREQ